MPDLDLSAIRHRADAATEGPWRVDGAPDDVKAVCGGLEVRNGIVRMRYIAIEIDADADAEFIAAARTDIPALLAELSRVTAERDAAREIADTAIDANRDLIMKFAAHPPAVAIREWTAQWAPIAADLAAGLGDSGKDTTDA